MVEQFVPEDAAVVPDLTGHDRRIIKLAVSKQAKEVQRKCIVCEHTAEYAMRGLPNNVYCKQCALDYFKFLNYLEQLK